MRNFWIIISLLGALNIQAASRLLGQTAHVYNDLHAQYQKDGPIVFKNYIQNVYGFRFAKDIPALFKGFPKLPRAELRGDSLYFGKEISIALSRSKSFRGVYINGKAFEFNEARGVPALRREMENILNVQEVSRRGGSVFHWLVPSAEAAGVRVAISSVGGAAIGIAVGILGTAIISALKKSREKKYLSEDRSSDGKKHTTKGEGDVDEDDDTTTTTTPEPDPNLKAPDATTTPKPDSGQPLVDVPNEAMRGAFCEPVNDKWVPTAWGAAANALDQRGQNPNPSLGPTSISREIFQTLHIHQAAIDPKEPATVQRYERLLNLVAQLNSSVAEVIKENAKTPGWVNNNSEKLGTLLAPQMDMGLDLKSESAIISVGIAKIKLTYKKQGTTRTLHSVSRLNDDNTETNFCQAI